MTQDDPVPDPRITWPAGHLPAAAMVFAHNAIGIAATPETVWSLLIDCVRWPSWYKHCSDASILRDGPVLRAGSKFRFKTLGFFFEPDVVTFEPSRMLVWSARGPAGTSGAHAWHIEATADGCHVITEETQKGWLLRLIGRRTRKTLLASHEEWLRALKALAEAS